MAEKWKYMLSSGSSWVRATQVEFFQIEQV
jgi:hypothetical protein